MAHGEVGREHAGIEPRPSTDPQQPGTGRAAPHLRWVCGAGADPLGTAPVSHPADRARGRDGVPNEPVGFVPPQRGGDPDDCVDGPVDGPAATCLSDRPGWAGAYRHGAVRPPQRAHRRERPPRRWC
ncbi:MAG TPA: hypothetical protein VGD43_24790 [Micromonospora sp.]